MIKSVPVPGTTTATSKIDLEAFDEPESFGLITDGSARNLYQEVIPK